MDFSGSYQRIARIGCERLPVAVRMPRMETKTRFDAEGFELTWRMFIRDGNR